MKDIFLLDLDDTLLDFPKAEEENFRTTLRSFGIDADERLFSRFHAINDGLWKALERGEISRGVLIVERFRLLFLECGIRENFSVVAERYYGNFPAFFFPFDGAADFLRKLKERGRTFIVTNGGSLIQRTHIARAGFGPLLDGIFISEEIGADKPSLAFADFVETHIPDYDRSRALWVGDSLTSDGRCAKDRGIDFLLFAPRALPAQYDGPAARSYQEVLAFLDQSSPCSPKKRRLYSTEG